MICPEKIRKMVFSLLLLTCLFPVQADISNTNQITIMSTRKQPLVEPVLQAYTQKTGVQIRFLQVSRKEMLDAFKTGSTKVDIYLANDMAVLYLGEQMEAFLPVLSDDLNRNVPAYYRSKNNLWFASTARARALIYNPEKVHPSQLLSYATLSTPVWQGRLCLRDGYSEYNLFLISSLIDRYGKDNTKRIMQGWKMNLAIPPTKKDTEAIKAVAAGKCDVTIANHYYFTRLKAEQPDIKAAIFWPDQKSQGVHMGLSGFALAKTSQNQKEASALLEWLASEEGQKLLTDYNDEFTINPKVSSSKASSLLGTFRKDQLPLDDLVDDVPTAKSLVEEVGLGL